MREFLQFKQRKSFYYIIFHQYQVNDMMYFKFNKNKC